MRVTTSNPVQPGGGLEALEPRLLFCATWAITADLATSLDAWWRFDDLGVSRVTDQSGSAASHPGTLNGGASVSALGLCGGAGVFAGGEMNVVNHSDINLGINTQRTIALWFLAEDVGASGRRLLYEEGAGTRGLNIYLDEGQLVVGGWNRSESNWQGTWLATGAISPGRWHHVVLTLDGGPATQPGALRGYIDGVLFGVGEGSQLWSHSGDITIGGVGDTRFPDGTSGAAGFIGRIDDMRLYNRALSAHDVAVLSGRFNEGAAIDLATHWRDDLIGPHDAGDEDAGTDAPRVEDLEDVALLESATRLPVELPAESHAAPGTDLAPEAASSATPPESIPTHATAAVEPAEESLADHDQDGDTPEDAPPRGPTEPRIAEVETEGKGQIKPYSSSVPARPGEAPCAVDQEGETHLLDFHPAAVRDDGWATLGG